MWFALLGTFLEKRDGPLTLAAMIFVAQPLISLFQYSVSGPDFMGMSGMVAFLVAYLWLRGALSPKMRIGWSRYTIWICAACVALTFTGLLGTVGKSCHAAGLVLGFSWALIAAVVEKLKIPKPEPLNRFAPARLY